MSDETQRSFWRDKVIDVAVPLIMGLIAFYASVKVMEVRLERTERDAVAAAENDKQIEVRIASLERAQAANIPPAWLVSQMQDLKSRLDRIEDRIGSRP